MIREKKCLECGKLFERSKNGYGDKQWAKRKYCSPKCARKNFSVIRKKQWENPTYKKMMSEAHIGNISWYKGKKRPDMTGENNPNWKGDDVSYVPLHSWVVRKLGKPNTCEKCGKTGLKGRKIAWANISRAYKRELTDWVRLCAGCHLIFDGINPPL